ncbi:zinc transporter ZIP12-like [Gigantopelta aegis]|uniref:zinc transporter ZIP12-like n=1 Tax=Gigantopelta aegis TaxID=1735272 RepID=UPI001B88BCE6|nr:zinc transporter ZIP12-like [Gigantopelta aegis]
MREFYKYGLYVFVFFAFSDVACQVTHGHGFDTFEEILERFHTQDNFLSFNNTKLLTEDVFGSLHCEKNASLSANACTTSLCLDVPRLFQLVGAQEADRLTESEFHQASLVIVYYMFNVQMYCGQMVDPTSNNMDYYTQQLRSFLLDAGANRTQEQSIGDALGRLNMTYTQHQDSHAGHGHGMNGVAEVKVIEDMCLSADAVFYRFGKGLHHVNETELTEITAFIIFHVVKGSTIKLNCRLLPSPEYFIQEIEEIINSNGNMFTLKQFELLMTKLKLVAKDDHSGHDHGTHVVRKRRSALSAGEGSQTLKRRRRSTVSHEHAKECYSADELMAIYGIDHASPFTEAQFTQLSPSLVYLQVSNSCVADSTQNTSPDRIPTDLERYGYGSLANFIVCMCAAAGAILYPCLQGKSSVFDSFMALFLGLAVGTLSSDAVLHLIPQAFGLHGHEGDGHDHSGDSIVVEDFVWFGLVTLAGLYFFYLIEAIMTMAGGAHSHSDEVEMVVNVPAPQENGKPNCEVYNVDQQLFNEPKKQKHGICSAVSLMIILGDAIHNFADGLAMGAAFTQGVTQGVATTIAIFCHELPHELGDFAVLIKNGMSFRQALAWNLLSAVTSFIGLYIGLSVSTEAQTRQWIFAVTAGMFLYIALVDILPSLLQTKVKRAFPMFIMHNLGILLGFLSMVLLAVFEDHIKL